ncbi:hypothetical protein [Pseudobacteroides cellulosolvens]|uniref:hypothetical protein n=1 Tax=Pseudobacteroides cellulosolvens TaxID=35825 RepID=UPI00068273F0|nr:hypothetical protein [Pseudobacteroides cellulosolvens]
MRGFYIGLPEIMAAQFSSFDWYFSSCIFSKSIDIAVFAASGFSAKACIFTGFFSKSGGFTYEGFSIWKPLL